MSEEKDSPKTTIFFGDESYSYLDILTDTWNPAYYKTGREVDTELWEKYKEARKHFDEMHEKLLEKFGK